MFLVSNLYPFCPGVGGWCLGSARSEVAESLKDYETSCDLAKLLDKWNVVMLEGDSTS